MKKTRYYVKDIYKKDKKIKKFFAILIVFLFGLYVGLAVNYLELQEKDKKIREQYVELDDLKESLHREEFNITD